MLMPRPARGPIRGGRTRGLLDTLSEDELEAVLAHELTHIRNRDTQLMVVAVIFAGIFAFFGDLVIRGWDFPYGWAPRSRTPGPWGTSTAGGGGRDGNDDGGRRGGDGGGRSSSSGGAVLAMVVAIVIILITWGVSTLIRLALSRSREFLADAGSAELTKNPDALIRALRKIEPARASTYPREEAFLSRTRGGAGSAACSQRPLDRDRSKAAPLCRRVRHAARVSRQASGAAAALVAIAVGVVVDAHQHRRRGVDRYGKRRARGEGAHIGRRRRVLSSGRALRHVLVPGHEPPVSPAQNVAQHHQSPRRVLARARRLHLNGKVELNLLHRKRRRPSHRNTTV